MKLKRYAYIIFLCLVNCLISYSQKLNLQKFSVKEGLIQSTVKEIEEDTYGNLWLATNYGLSKFNGKTFENFTTTNHLPANEVSCLLFTNDILFIGTGKGLCLYNGSKIENMPLFEKIHGGIRKLLKRNQEIHIITDKGYYVLNISTTPFSLDSVAIANIYMHNITDAEFDEDNNLWIATSKKGLFFIEENISTKIPKFILIQNSVSSTSIRKKLARIVNFNSENLLKSNMLYSIEFDKNKNLLVSDWANGIAQVKFDFINSNGFFANYIQFDSSIISPKNFSRIVNIQKDTEGNIYLASDGNGFLKVPIDKNTNEINYDSKDVVSFNSQMGFYGNYPLCFRLDSRNNLWVGTLNDGIILYNNKSSMSYNQKSGLLEEKVISTFHATDSSIWVGTYGGGAFRYKDKSFSHCFWEQGISESIIKTILEDDFGNIWLGTMGGGISIIRKEQVTKRLDVAKKISVAQHLTSEFVTFLFKSKDGSIWVGFQGQNRIDRIVINKDLSYSITPSPIISTLPFSALCITEDDDGDIWIASYEGVWHYNPKTGYVNTEYSGFKNIQTMAKDQNGNIWLGSSDIGAIILKNKLKVSYFENGPSHTFEKIAMENGISSNCINSILFNKEEIWFITNNGMNELKLDTYLNKITSIKSYHKGNGFASYDNKPNSAVFDMNHIIWIGSIEGLTQYQNLADADNSNHNEENLTVFINKILIDNKALDWTNKSLFDHGEYTSITFNGFFNWYKIPKNLEVDYNHNSLQFTINTDDIGDQRQVNYAYKLNGFDHDWSQMYNSNEITYRNLPSGDYTLLIKASLGNDFLNATEYSYYFSVTPPFWKTKAFSIIILLVIISSLYFYISIREKRLKREKMKLELIVKARTSEIENKKQEIELQNTLIQGINNDLTDSIKYAQRIQQTILPNTEVLKNYFSDHFIYYKPRNIVSGDYYWVKELEGLIYIAVVDCTGHGVPGAFMSLISSNILNEAINEDISVYGPAKMVEHLRKKINYQLKQNTTEQVNDGLDIALICFNKEKNVIEYVNANRPLYIISNNELITLASENINIGGYADFDITIPSKIVSINPGDSLFLFTDGITDQFGGPKNKKYNPARLRQFLLLNTHLSLHDLKEKMEEEISTWQGSYEQTDDILLMGLKI